MRFGSRRTLLIGTPPAWLAAGLAEACTNDEAPPEHWDVLLCADSVHWPSLDNIPADTIHLDDPHCVRIVPGASASAARAAFRSGHRRLLPFVPPQDLGRALTGATPGRWRHAPRASDPGHDPLARAFLRHVAMTPELDPLKCAASELGVSLRTLERHVKSQLRSEPRHVLAAYRADLRDWLLLAGFPVAEVALACGYGTASALCHAVRRETGLSSSAWTRTLLAEVGL